MEDKNNVMKFEDEKMDSVTGGYGDKPYTKCPCYSTYKKLILPIEDKEQRREAINKFLITDCRTVYYFDCDNCPAYLNRF